MSLYLRYRPLTIEELDLEDVRQALGSIVESGNVSHAYLFSGPKGSGKTSSARILARVINCKENEKELSEPCGKCGFCKEILRGSAVDIVEIDAASNRGIDDIRDLKQKIRLAPSSLRKKVYIIDEVHMLTKEAFNALLKTLEEPPSHSIFILCTTEAHKLPETITSRCMRIGFRQASVGEMLRSLRRVVKGEKAKVEAEALEYLASQVDGSFRDGVKILEQVLQKGELVTVADMEKVLHGVSGFDPKIFVECMSLRDAAGALKFVRKVIESGVDLSYFLTLSMSLIRDSLLLKYGLSESELEFGKEEEMIELVYLLDRVVGSFNAAKMPELLVEMAVLEWCGEKGGEGAKNGVGKVGKKKSKMAVENKDERVVERKKAQNEGANKEAVSGNGSGRNGDNLGMNIREMRSGWQELLKQIDKSSYSLEALLSSATPRGVEDDVLVIEVLYEFHRQQLESERFKSQVERLAKIAYKCPVKVRFEVSESKGLSKKVSDDNIGETQEDDIVSMAEDIFIN